MAASSSVPPSEPGPNNFPASPQSKFVIVPAKPVITPIKKLNPYQPKWTIKGIGERLVVALKWVKVTSFNGKSLSTGLNSECFINPTLPEAEQLRTWATLNSKELIPVSLSSVNINTTNIAGVHEVAQLQVAKKVLIMETIIHVNMSNFCYASCTNVVNGKQCRKKVVQTDEGTWHCPKCNVDSSECTFRYALNLLLEDTTGTVWATAFEDVGSSIMGLSAQALYDIAQQPDQLPTVLEQVLFCTYDFGLLVKKEIYNDNEKLAYTIIHASQKKASPTHDTVVNALLNASTP
ncbi:hypothetical protein KI387_009587 [Taxus chinensis]|uniref:Replication factor A C-terminal domain-containing protein n=1 Tax=Taxus chinensis TaxID=29808 RepID=A0AA38FKA2_TAXCH|nr:hypothetical protein KI387_009587 [Taxus chinensis]